MDILRREKNQRIICSKWLFCKNCGHDTMSRVLYAVMLIMWNTLYLIQPNVFTSANFCIWWPRYFHLGELIRFALVISPKTQSRFRLRRVIGDKMPNLIILRFKSCRIYDMKQNVTTLWKLNKICRFVSHIDLNYAIYLRKKYLWIIIN